jgi:hypothetical protein
VGIGIAPWGRWVTTTGPLFCPLNPLPAEFHGMVSRATHSLARLVLLRLLALAAAASAARAEAAWIAPDDHHSAALAGA